MGVSLLLLAIALSFVIVRVGAVAFELTGLPWEQAKFQALSAFSNSGFTTKEAEAIVRHPLRRRIASYLIVLGNAGLVTAVGSFASSMARTDPVHSLINFAATIGGASLIVYLARVPRVMERVRKAARSWLSQKGDWDAPTEAEMLRLDEGFALTQISLPPDSPGVGHELKQLKLKQNSVQILSIQRDERFSPIPGGDFELAAGDVLTLYGLRHEISRIFDAEAPSSVVLMTEVREAYAPTLLGTAAHQESPPEK